MKEVSPSRLRLDTAVSVLDNVDHLDYHVVVAAHRIVTAKRAEKPSRGFILMIPDTYHGP